MKLSTYAWRRNQPITEQYIHSYEDLADWYEYDPWKEESLARRASYLDGERKTGLAADRGKLVEALERYNERVSNNHEAVHKNLDALRDELTLTIVGGQQPGLLTGPMLVVYKAITILSLAKQAERKLGRKVVPVFWIAGEDHDFAEVNHTYLNGKDGGISRLAVGTELQPRASVSFVELPDQEKQELLGRLEELLQDTEFKTDLLAELAARLESSLTISDAFGRELARWFGAHGLVLLDSADSGIRSLESEMFRCLIERGEAINRALLEQAEDLRQAGYPPQAEVRDGQSNLFLIDGNERRLLFRTEKGSYADRKQECECSEAELLRIATEEPQRLSNNVFTRPLMQEFLFPVLGTVLGGAEIAYWGLLKEAFRVVGMRMPILYPRYEYTVLEGTIQKQMRKFGLEFSDAVTDIERLKQAWLKEQDELQLEERFDEAKLAFRNVYEPLVESLDRINPGIRQLGDNNMQKILDQIDFLRKKATDASAAQHDAGTRQWDRIAEALIPMGKPQERVYNMYNYVNKYGPGWMDELVDMQIDDAKRHRILVM